MSIPSLYYLDTTGVALFCNGEHVDKYFSLIAPSYRTEISAILRLGSIVITPYWVLEVLGVRLKLINQALEQKLREKQDLQINLKLSDSDEAWLEKIANIHSFADDYYNQHPLLRDQELKALLGAAHSRIFPVNHSSIFSYRIWQGLEGWLDRPGAHAELCKWLTYSVPERHIDLLIPKHIHQSSEIRQRLQNHLMAGYVTAWKKGINMSGCEGLLHSLAVLNRKPSIDFRPKNRDGLPIEVKPFRAFNDRADIDVVQMLTMGAFGTLSRLEKTAVFSVEAEENIVARVHPYQTLFAYAKEKFSSNKHLQLPSDLKPGVRYQVVIDKVEGDGRYIAKTQFLETRYNADTSQVAWDWKSKNMAQEGCSNNLAESTPVVPDLSA